MEHPIQNGGIIEEESAESSSENASNHEMEDGNSSNAELSDDLDVSEEEESDEDEVDIWGIINDETVTDQNNVLETVKRKIKFCRALKRDSTIAAIRNTMDSFRENDVTIGFEEALDYAIDKRKFLIGRTLTKRRAEEEDGSE